MRIIGFFLVFTVVMFSIVVIAWSGTPLSINDKGYFEKPGLNVIVLDDIYPEGKQGGITIIQHGKRVAANGNISLQPTPGQWQPYPKLLHKEVINDQEKIIATLKFPDSSRITTNDQPIIYPDFDFTYKLNVIADQDSFRIIVDLEKPLPDEWVGKVGMNLELFPGLYFGKTFYLGGKSGIFPRYANSPVGPDTDNEYEAVAMAFGPELVLSPEDPYTMLTIKNPNGQLQLLDGRVKHNNGWFVIRSLIPAGATKNAMEWIIKTNVVDSWQYNPVIHVSQVGYHVDQSKVAVIELDKTDLTSLPVIIERITPQGGYVIVDEITPAPCDDFLRYRYLKADFSAVKGPGMYVVRYGKSVSNIFKIDENVYKEGVWQPTLEYFLPVQMCHMKIFEKYRVWHDRCHLDDALVAPEHINHFDTYVHDTVPAGFEPFQHIDGLDRGGWHDAGDYDFRIESQLGTILTLAYIYEEFGVDHDQTLIDQVDGIVEIHHPDGKPDVLQQIEHGLLTVLGGYRQFGQFYRGILCPTLRQYPLMGDAAAMTDNKVFDGKRPAVYEGFWYDQVYNRYEKYFTPQKNHPVDKEYVPDLDDRFVFFEDNPQRQVSGICALAASARVLDGYNDELAAECLRVAKEIWDDYKKENGRRMDREKIKALVELILTTDEQYYKQELLKMLPQVINNIDQVGWTLGRVLDHIDDKAFADAVNLEISKVKDDIEKASLENPFAIPYHPNIWGAGWGIQRLGFMHYFLYTGWPDIFTIDPMLNSLNFILGCHPGENTTSFVSNVGHKSLTVAYGVNRVEWSFIPGGVGSGTNLVRPDLPELLEWPFLWQQAEYVIGGGATNFMFLVLAADKLLSDNPR